MDLIGLTHELTNFGELTPLQKVKRDQFLGNAGVCFNHRIDTQSQVSAIDDIALWGRIQSSHVEIFSAASPASGR
jgi:hypothetical protein